MKLIQIHLEHSRLVGGENRSRDTATIHLGGNTGQVNEQKTQA